MILCHGTESKKGSGTIVCLDDTLYVLTAAHVVSISENKRYDKEKISITAVKGDKIYTFKVEKIERYDYNQDCAVLKVSNENSFPEEPLKQVRILKAVPNGEGALCGFGNDEHEVKVYPFEQVGDTTWALHGFDVSLQPITAKENWGGFSGGGIFYKGENGELYLSCYMKGLTDIEGNNNGFVCYPAMRFTDVAALQKLISNEKVVYVTDEGSMGDSKINNNLPHFLTSSPMKANSTNVIGREKDLQKLWEALKDKKHVMLTGLGGIGKTKLAQLLFHEYESEFDEVAWIDYQGGLRKSFLACINDTRFRESNYQDEKEQWNAINSTLANDGKKKLIIIDNVDSDIDQNPELDTELQDLTGWKDITILLTSRLEQLGGFENITLSSLEKDNCIRLFNLYYQGKIAKKETIIKIVKLANMHTFTIELLAKGAKREDLDEYYKKVKDGFEKVARTMTTGHHGGNATIEQHLKVLFDMQKRSELDKRILNSFAILPVNCECTMNEIEQWFGFENADLDAVIQDGWLSFDDNNQVCSMHPLVRTIIRFDFGEFGQKKRIIAPQGVVEPLLNYLESHGELLIDMNKGFTSVNRMKDITESAIGAVSQKETIQMATLFHSLGYCLDNMGDYDKALEYYGKALEIRESKLGKDHPDTATTYNNIAMVYWDKGEYDNALKYLEKTLKISESKLGKDHPDTATIYNNIALVYNDKGDYDKALEYHGKALIIREAKLGKDHLETATTYNNIALVYYNKRDYDEALEYYREALTIKETKLGNDHPDTATIYNNMALVYNDKDDHDKALEYYGKALIIREAKLGKDHLETATTYNNVAVVYCAKGDYVKALEYVLKAFRIRLIKFENHQDTISSFQDLIICYQMANMEKDFFEWLKEQLNEKEWVAYLVLMVSLSL